MRLRKRIALSLLVGCAGFVSAGENSAVAAEPSIYFYPKTAWQISKPAAQRCELKNEFDNGFVMRISGSNSGRSNVDYMSIDFIQPAFGNGQSYPVEVSVPGLVNKKINAVAESARVLQVGVRGHSDVVQGMESTGAFDLAIDSNHFRFYMTGLNDAMKKFKNCTQGLSPRPALEAEPALRQASLPTPKYEQMDLRQKPGIVPVQEILPEPVSVEPKEIDLSSPPFDGPVVSTPVDVSASVRPSSSGKRDYLDRMRNNEYGGMQNSKSVSLDASVENQPSVRSHASASPDADTMLPLPGMGGSVKKVEPVKAVSPQLSSASDTKMPEPLRAKYSREKITATADFAADADRRAAANEPFSDGDFERISTRKGRKTSKRLVDGDVMPSPVSASSSGAMNEKVSDLTRRVVELERKNLSLKEELEEAYKATEEERLAISSDNWNLERATMRFNEAERQIDRLGRQLQRQKAQCSSEKRDLEAMLFDPKLTEESQLAALSRLEEENIRYKARIKALEARLGTN